jgi:hypothetical protein
MSHNAFSVNGVEPNDQGQITGFSATRQAILIGRGYTNTYATSPASSLGAGATLYFFDSSPVNGISGATINSTDGWIDSVTIPAGRYLIKAYFSVLFSASGAFEFVLKSNTAQVGNSAVIGATTIAALDGARFAHVSFSVATSVSISCAVVSASNVSAIASQGSVPAEESWMLIERLA